MTRVIGIVSGKGGVGKTFVTINLAAAMNKYCGKETLIVDCNLSTPHIGLYLGVYSTPVTLNDVLKEKASAKDSIYAHSSGISFLPASLKLKDIKYLNVKRIRHRIEDIFNNYDYVFVDSAPGFGQEGLIPIYLCNETIFVTTPIMHSACDLIKCRQIFSEYGLKNMGIVLNMVKKKPWELSPMDVKELVGCDVIGSIPYDDNVTKCILMKKTVIDTRHKVSDVLRDLAYYLEGIPKKQGFFERAFSIFTTKYEPPAYRAKEEAGEVGQRIIIEPKKKTEEKIRHKAKVKKDTEKIEKEVSEEIPGRVTSFKDEEKEDKDYIDLETLLKKKLKEKMEGEAVVA